MRDKIFIDTNILVYLVKDNTGKAEIISGKIKDKDNSYFSTQVANEFCNIALKLSRDSIFRLHRQPLRSHEKVSQRRKHPKISFL